MINYLYHWNYYLFFNSIISSYNCHFRSLIR